MKQYEIWWDDLTESAQERLKELYHENIYLNPLAIIEIEEEDLNDDNQLKLDFENERY